MKSFGPNTETRPQISEEAPLTRKMPEPEYHTQQYEGLGLWKREHC